jgi:NTE family protein
MMRHKIRILLILVMVTSFGITFGENTVPHKRPTVGLVLSGGGARGFAHIGVLKVLEESRIPVDYIGGASMGALIGGMYTMGRTPAEIEQFVNSLDWGRLFQPSVSFENLSFRRKEDRLNIPAPVSLRGKINDLKLPNALNSGQEIGLLLDRETILYASVTNFDDLPIPFRAVGTDMVNGTPVTLKSGSLSRSLLATMSIPGVFSPVEVDGKILADGGLVNNIPTDVVKEMGADILIVVNIETELQDRESLRSLPGVLAQTINIVTFDNSRRSLREADFIIAPDLGKYSMGDFPESRHIIELGYQGAQKKVFLLKGLALDEQEWQEHLADRRKREQHGPPPVPKFVTVAETDADSTRTILEKLGERYTDQPLGPNMLDALTRDLLDLKGTGRFESLDYGLIQKDGQTGLLIRNNQISTSPTKLSRLELGLDVNSIKTDNVNFDFLARLTLFDVGSYGAEWRNDLQLGSNPALATEYFRPFGKTRFFISPQASYERRRINLFSEGTNLAEYIGQTVRAGIDLGYSPNSRNELRAGYAIGHQDFSRRIGDPLHGDLEGKFSRAGMSWTYNGLNRAQVPTKGILSRNTLNYYFDSPGAIGNFTQAETRINIFHAVGARNIIVGFGGAGATFGNSASEIQKFTLGGRLRLGGYDYEELRSDNYLLGGFGMLHNPSFFPLFLGGKAYLGAWYEAGSSFDRFSEADYLQSLSGGAIIETAFGPVFFGGSLNENGHGKFYFAYGRFF